MPYRDIHPAELAPGTVVRVITGSPLMTIEAVHEQWIDCVWFDPDQHGGFLAGPRRDRFRPGSLVVIEGP